jgi:hypothetical protein
MAKSLPHYTRSVTIDGEFVRQQLFGAIKVFGLPFVVTIRLAKAIGALAPTFFSLVASTAELAVSLAALAIAISLTTSELGFFRAPFDAISELQRFGTYVVVYVVATHAYERAKRVLDFFRRTGKERRRR